MICIYIAPSSSQSRVHSEFATLSLLWPCKIEKEGEGFDFIFLGGLVLEGKSKSLLNFCYCLGAYLKLCLRLMLI
jgi:hypothetical protein